MARQSRQPSGTGIYHVMMRGINHENIFEEHEDYYQFLNTLDMMARSYERFWLNWRVWEHHFANWRDWPESGKVWYFVCDETEACPCVSRECRHQANMCDSTVYTPVFARYVWWRYDESDKEFPSRCHGAIPPARHLTINDSRLKLNRLLYE